MVLQSITTVQQNRKNIQLAGIKTQNLYRTLIIIKQYKKILDPRSWQFKIHLVQKADSLKVSRNYY